MQEAIKRFRVRRAARLGIRTQERYDSVEQYRLRRAERMGIRLDADDDDGGEKGGHGNTKIPFGLCQREGIDIQKGWTPADAWKALEGKGYSAGETYQELKKTGKVSTNPKKAGPVKKDYSKMDYDTLVQEYKDHHKRYREAEIADERRERELKGVPEALETFKKFQKHGDYNGETYEQVLEGIETPKGYYKYTAMKKVMDNFGHDAFEKSLSEIEELAKKRTEELSARTNYAELNEERESIQKSMAAAAKEKYRKLSNCDSAASLEARIRSDDFYQPGEWLSSQIDYNEIDDKTASGIGKGLDILKKRFPKLKGMMNPPLINSEVRGSAYAHCETGPGKAQVTLSKNRFRDIEHLKEIMKNDVKSGFHPKGTGTIQGIVTHEYGHAIDDILTKKFKGELKGQNFSDYLLDRVTKKRKGETKEGVLAMVSNYAVKSGDPAEFLAEAFSEYCCSKTPRPIAMEVGQIMIEFIDRL